MHEVIVHLTDDEYAWLTAEAEKTGMGTEDTLNHLLREALSQYSRIMELLSHPHPKQELAEYLYSEGAIDHLPPNELLTEKEEAKLEHLEDLFQRKAAMSEMIKEMWQV